ncbi:Putative AAA+ ATPase domain, ATPase, AAA-type, core [Colletotrichum destructivum]|uniref:AAA+ ATPase domain, ATPase, AAA-type, core n=1 Tax=Colletotrichum destructivum TaxID=34406 RepID=A0AAX4IZZ4_9PEZI|nr:Putative AAA+ ATPase domain, ATPase, AAA-type, core [Colletotrichum destructivum]
MAGDTDNQPEEKPDSMEKKVLQLDQIWSRKDRQWHYVRTAKARTTEKLSRSRKNPLVVRRICGMFGKIEHVEIDVKSMKLAKLLGEILHDCLGLNLHKSPPQLSPQDLYHAWNGLTSHLEAEKSKSDADNDLISDILATREYLSQEYKVESESLFSLLQHNEITYGQVWQIFSPGTVIFSDNNVLCQPSASLYGSGSYQSDKDSKFFEISGRILTHDSEDFGWGYERYRIVPFEGTKKITSLEAYPIRYHQDAEPLQKSLIKRGRDYVRFMKEPTCREYCGLAVRMESSMLGPAKSTRFKSEGRIMVDPAAFGSHNPAANELLEPWVTDEVVVTDPDSLKDEDLLLCNHRILGYSFVQKTWAAFSVSNMSDVIWNEDAFDKLIIAEKKRRMIRLLVQSHKPNSDGSFDDIIKGKGRGLVGLLSGSPGVGKSLTAEAVAEVSHRPLYSVSAGELGTDVQRVDDRLGMILEIVRRWECVLLIDEADVFLYKRGESQVERNALVSIFLRRLEYFTGIIILTTNRQKDIDEAFKSRIHFKFHYPPLHAEARLKIWENMLASVTDKMPDWKLTDEDMRSLASKPLNGREIKNAVSCVASIIRANQEPLSMSLIKDILETLVEDEEPGDQ